MIASKAMSDKTFGGLEGQLRACTDLVVSCLIRLLTATIKNEHFAQSCATSHKHTFAIQNS